MHVCTYIHMGRSLVELLSKQHGNHLFRRTIVCSLQAQKCRSSHTVLFVTIEKERFTEKVYGRTICALLFFTDFVRKNSSSNKCEKMLRKRL
jgi:hypothetical protein